MIVGNGDIASVLKDKEGVVYFASGVSNSSEKRKSEFKREIKLLMEQDDTKHLVYFSSLCVFYSDTPYAEHKKKMEFFVKTYFSRHTIMRIGNITWGNNPNTLLNCLRRKIKNNEKFDIFDVHRYLISQDEFLNWINLIPEWNCEINCHGRTVKVADIITELDAEQE